MKKWTPLIIAIIMVVIFIITAFVVPPLLDWDAPSFLSWPDFLEYIKTAEGLIIAIVSQGIPVICVTIGAIFLLIFVIKLIRD
ncbi:hypothetical protein LCGC14_1460450 [marine sediment metagenome]|uniref:Uncharacterized protein n=1 Tax=marine sediment metagenome TaxID=412755 RepID=A0A0F9MH97_9ZZZZ